MEEKNDVGEKGVRHFYAKENLAVSPGSLVESPQGEAEGHQPQKVRSGRSLAMALNNRMLAAQHKTQAGRYRQKRSAQTACPVTDTMANTAVMPTATVNHRWRWNGLIHL